MAQISVEKIGDGEYRVEIAEGPSSTVHVVTAGSEDVATLGGGVPAEDLLRASFEYLLDREPKESILRRFTITDISRYFPGYPDEIGGYLGG